jgi:hypothetical protein
MYDTYNYAVDLPAGIYSARDILNLCCVANQKTTFYIQLKQIDVPKMLSSVAGSNLWYNTVSNDNGSNLIQRGVYFTVPGTVGPGRLVDDGIGGIRAGDLYLWQSEIDPAIKGPPTLSQIVDALASKDPRVRSVARNYIEMCWRVVDEAALVSEAGSTEKGIWTTVGVINRARTRSVALGKGPASDRMRKALQDDQELADKPGLKALAAMELARVTEDATFLEQVAKRPLSASEIADVKPDMIRSLRYSEFVRQKLLELNPPWAGFSKAEIQGLDLTNVFSLP